MSSQSQEESLWNLSMGKQEALTFSRSNLQMIVVLGNQRRVFWAFLGRKGGGRMYFLFHKSYEIFKSDLYLTHELNRLINHLIIKYLPFNLNKFLK